MEGIKGGSEKISVVATCGSIIAALIMFAAGCNRDQWILKSYDKRRRLRFRKEWCGVSSILHCHGLSCATSRKPSQAGYQP